MSPLSMPSSFDFLRKSTRSPSWRKTPLAKIFFSAETDSRLNSRGLGVSVNGGYLRVGRGEQENALGLLDASVLLPLLDELGHGLLAGLGQVKALVLDEGLQGLFGRRLAPRRPRRPAATEGSGGE